MLRELAALFAVCIAVDAADAGLTMVKKNYGSMDPPYCFAYQRKNPGTYQCVGFQYDCSGDTNQIGSDVDLSANCASASALRTFANSDFPSRYAAYKAAQGK